MPKTEGARPGVVVASLLPNPPAVDDCPPLKRPDAAAVVAGVVPVELDVGFAAAAPNRDFAAWGVAADTDGA